eukprot:CAMPEP_0204418676 /NCGR_PEP_ID=MMETSP0470-20130426/30334_1 /ASSEMBLY_ACC=CAM_ASM_000385 /TAXON_ID=2969 /ORGANISM="Oxyrrhis marina" /LENGTH=81 /DNA_ID=CAMNT_0051415465 /DNA_START=39 /DNA_END=282 /DNA_ORIENTATION=+
MKRTQNNTPGATGTSPRVPLLPGPSAMTSAHPNTPSPCTSINFARSETPLRERAPHWLERHGLPGKWQDVLCVADKIHENQ